MKLRHTLVGLCLLALAFTPSAQCIRYPPSGSGAWELPIRPGPHVQQWLGRHEPGHYDRGCGQSYRYVPYEC